MEKLLKDKIQILIDRVLSEDNKLGEIAEIFNNHFGEDRVDIQLNVDVIYNHIKGKEIRSILNDCSFITSYRSISTIDEEEFVQFIELFEYDNVIISNLQIPVIIHHPIIHIENEYGESHTIQELYTKIYIDLYGTMSSSNIYGIRSVFSKEEFDVGYAHSHLPSLSRGSIGFRRFCLGEGPIKGTITSLYGEYDYDTWVLFCWELSNYLKVESIAGGPHIRMNNIGATSKYSIQYNINSEYLYPHDTLSSFAEWLIMQGELKFNNTDKFNLAYSDVDFIIHVSNKFIYWYNEIYLHKEGEKIHINELFECGFLRKVIIQNDMIYTYESDIISYSEYQNTKLFTFKDKDILLKIIEDNNDAIKNEITIVNTSYCTYLKNRITDIIRFYYANTTISEYNSERRAVFT